MIRRLVAVVALLGALLVAPAASSSAAKATVAPDGAVLITGLDLHDGQIVKWGSTYYFYGTMYACGFTWLATNTPWCGFGVSTAPALDGPWSAPTLLFPANAADPYNVGKTYQATCGATGAGCFSPRMIQRSGWGANDGVFILWFNAPWYKSNGGAQHAYMAMGCNGPAGPCGASAGAPYGSTHRPSLHQCNGANGDPGIIAGVDANALWLLCPSVGLTSVGLEKLSTWGTDGANVGTAAIPTLTKAEAMGGWYDAASSTWFATYAAPGCGYCTGTGVGYMTAPSAAGPWTVPNNLGVAGWPFDGRALFGDVASCGGQVDTVSVIDGVPWQKVDLWTGAANETAADTYLVPLTFRADPVGTPGDGGLFRGILNDWSCQ